MQRLVVIYVYIIFNDMHNLKSANPPRENALLRIINICESFYLCKNTIAQSKFLQLSFFSASSFFW